jgi:hypothetical protein
MSRDPLAGPASMYTRGALSCTCAEHFHAHARSTSMHMHGASNITSVCRSGGGQETENRPLSLFGVSERRETGDREPSPVSSAGIIKPARTCTKQAVHIQ